jgi:hypothetical protein
MTVQSSRFDKLKAPSHVEGLDRHGAPRDDN